MDEDDPEAAAVAEQIVIDNHNAIEAAGAVTPHKRTREEAMLEVCGQNEEELENFDFTMARDGSGSAAVLELQEKVQFLGKHLKAIPVLQTVKDISRLDSTVAALTNKVGFNGSDVAPRSIMDHVDSLLTHAGIVDSKVAEVDTRVDTVEASAQVACDVTINKWIA